MSKRSSKVKNLNKQPKQVQPTIKPIPTLSKDLIEELEARFPEYIPHPEELETTRERNFGIRLLVRELSIRQRTINDAKPQTAIT